MIKIKQKHYGLIEIDNRETDIILIWNTQQFSNNVIEIERENLPKLIEILKKELKK